MKKGIKHKKPLLGFIGQGFVGKNYADNFEKRGYDVVRYALEEPYRKNKEKIKDCSIVFVCVPTPTTPKGFDASIVENALRLVGKGKVAVIKSTILPGTTEQLQKKHPNIILLYSPEFLFAVSAAEDAANPFSNIVGIAKNSPRARKAAEEVHAVLPKPAFLALTCASTEAELIKYAHNGSGYVQIMFFNLMYDLAVKLGYGWENIGAALQADPLISNHYSRPVHKSGRGAGGPCFIKDFAALSDLYAELLKGDKKGSAVFHALEQKNIALLRASKKDLNLLTGVYGKKVLKKK